MRPLLLRACLLAALWTAGVTGDDPPQAEVTGAGQPLTPAADLLWSAVHRAVTAAVQPLTARIDKVQEVLESQLNSRLDSVQSTLEAQINSIQSTLEAQLSSVQSTLDAQINSVQSTQEAQINSVKSSQEAQINSVQATLEAQLNSVRSGLASLLDNRIDSVKTELKFHSDSVRTAVESRLDSFLVSQLHSRLDSIQTNLDSRLDSVENQLDSGKPDSLEAGLVVSDAQPAGARSLLDSAPERVQSESNITVWDLDSLRVQPAAESSPSDGAQAVCGEERTLTTATARLESRIDSAQAAAVSALASRLETVQSVLTGRLDSMHSRLDTGLSGVETELSTARSLLTSRLAGVTGVPSDLRSRLPVTSSAGPAADCSDLPAGSPSGVYLLRPGPGGSVPAYCDLETDDGNWTVFQRRAYIQPHQDFYLGWDAYKYGFGDLQGEFWWGLEHLWRVTTLLIRQYELRVNLEDFEGQTRFAVYNNFSLSSKNDGYRLTVSGYDGDAGDALTYSSGMRFTTKDKDRDNHSKNCAMEYFGAWWYNACRHANLNGLYRSGPAKYEGVSWHKWRGFLYSLKHVEMKIRPKH